MTQPRPPALGEVSPASVRGSALGDCPTTPATAYDAGLFDLDGVVYLGTSPVPHAAESLAVARDGGLRAMFVTNNASRTPDQVVGVLAAAGVPATGDDVVTSAQAAAVLLAAECPDGGAVLVVGGDGLRSAVQEAGFTVVGSADDSPVAVAQGFDPSIGYDQLAEAVLAVRSGAVWVASNTDSTIPGPRGLLPGNGALVAAVSVATGATPLVAGKPDGALHAESVRRSGARNPLVVGDRLDTDIEAAILGGTDSLLVLTGVCTVAQLLSAPVGARPTYVSADLRGLHESHPRVELADGAPSCGGVRAVVVGDSVDVSGEGGPTAVLRAACAASWAAVDGGSPAATRIVGAAAGALAATAATAVG
ncbi:MAG TPA: HAD-IIA family hydrolase [Mycobacteriales bacterium]|nr:HAD-IIA family hydrolase [Mycobacteriales bacterium]